jgi:hypothetical protein
MYADGASIEDIIAGTGLTQALLYRWLDGGGLDALAWAGTEFRRES